jgi:hypothetical protein
LILMPDGEAMAEVSSLFLAGLDGHRRCSFRRVSVEGWEKQRIHMLPKSRTCMSVSREIGFVWPSPPPAQKACGALYVSCLTANELVMFTIAVVSFHQPEGTRELAVLYPPRFCVFRALINVQANAGVLQAISSSNIHIARYCWASVSSGLSSIRGEFSCIPSWCPLQWAFGRSKAVRRLRNAMV